jgi:hypothetical protein
MYPNATAWLSHQQQQNQHIHEPQHVPPDGRPPSADAWKERASGVTTGSTLDLSDFGLGDIPGEQRFYKRPTWAAVAWHNHWTTPLATDDNQDADMYTTVI